MPATWGSVTDRRHQTEFLGRWLWGHSKCSKMQLSYKPTKLVCVWEAVNSATAAAIVQNWSEAMKRNLYSTKEKCLNSDKE